MSGVPVRAMRSDVFFDDRYERGRDGQGASAAFGFRRAQLVWATVLVSPVDAVPDGEDPVDEVNVA